MPAHIHCRNAIIYISISVHSYVIMTVRAAAADRTNNPHQHVTNYPSVNKTRIYLRTMVNIMVIQTLIMFIIS